VVGAVGRVELMFIPCWYWRQGTVRAPCICAASQMCIAAIPIGGYFPCVIVGTSAEVCEVATPTSPSPTFQSTALVT